MASVFAGLCFPPTVTPYYRRLLSFALNMVSLAIEPVAVLESSVHY
uniref:Uncharacterized protein n=1 Tax=Rhizophora mucronata TaxID=61149 RepID=A0A2P2QIQ9_RHIMU